MKIISRKEAKKQGLKRYFTGKSCKHGHICEKYISGHCIECLDKHNKNRKEYFINYYEKNTEHIKEYEKTRYKTNPEYKKEWGKEWRQEHPAENAAKTAKRRSAKLQRTPIWLTKDELNQIQVLYKRSMFLTKLYGTSFHVDHIIPLCGVDENGKESVCGLHTLLNLQILIGTKNREKWNKFII